MRISDWSSDVCSSMVAVRADLAAEHPIGPAGIGQDHRQDDDDADEHEALALRWCRRLPDRHRARDDIGIEAHPQPAERSEEHTSELQPLLRNSYAVLCLKKTTKIN